MIQLFSFVPREMEDPLFNPLNNSEDELGPFPPPPLGLETDPWYALRDELAHEMRRALVRIEKIKLLTTYREVSYEIESLRKTLGQLKDSHAHIGKIVSKIEKARQNFIQLADEDVFSRRQFYLGIQNRIKQLENDLLMAEKNSKQLLEQENRQQLQLEQKSTLKSEK